MMKFLVAITSFFFLLVSCDHAVEDKLEGKWQLKTIEANGLIQSVDTVWYNFQTSLFSYQVYNAYNDRYVQNYGYKTLEDDTHLDLELVNYGRITAQQFVEQYTDWEAVTESFAIVKVSSKHLVLSRQGKTYTFRKY